MSRLKADENPIVLKTFSFAVNAARYCQLLQKNKDFPLANQLFKSSNQLVPMSGKHKMQRSKPILFTNSKLL